MGHLDITIDFETCAMSANAAPMQVAMVPWLRDNDMDPFCNEQEVSPFVGYVDLRTCVVDGFDFDPETIRWWAGRNAMAKEAVCKGEPDSVDNVLIGMLNYIRGLRANYELTSICVWCQGMDFDIAILRNLCRKYGVELEEDIPHTQFRDCRTVIMEAALKRAYRLYREAIAQAESLSPDGTPSPLPDILPADVLRGDYKIYNLFAPLPDRYAGGSEAHDALYDAYRSSWNTWQALKWLNQ